MNNVISQFCDAIRATGLEPPKFIEPGKLHRFPGVGKRNSNRAGWCKLFDDGFGGCFGDWSTGFTHNWQAKRNKPLSRSEHSSFMRQIEQTRIKAEANLKAKRISAANSASVIWNSSHTDFTHHPYLISKGIKVNNARLRKKSLVLPVRDFSGTLTSLQFISPDGRKLLMKDGRKHGCFIPVSGELTKPTRVIICEGWATGCSIAEEESTSLVLAAIDAGNLQAVAIAARHCWPTASIIIAGDDDRLTEGNSGASKARAAAIAAGASLAIPQWPKDAPTNLSDFNDLACWRAANRNKGVSHE